MARLTYNVGAARGMFLECAVLRTIMRYSMANAAQANSRTRVGEMLSAAVLPYNESHVV